MRRRLRRAQDLASTALLSLGLAATAACGADLGTDGECTTGKCDSFDSTVLEGRADPIAKYLKGVVGADGTMSINYKDALFGVAATMGCGPETISTFTLSDDLIAGRPFPRLISVACASDDAKASDFFIAASFEDRATGDVDLRDVEMFAWDPGLREYKFYAFHPVSKDKVQLEVDPKRCEQCHMTPADVSPIGMRMTPIMNEINRPWTHWNAEPGFPSHEFSVPEGMDEMPGYKSLAIEHRAPAQRFEEIIRFGGHAKVSSARIRDRRNAPNLDEIMAMFRPIFCAEQLNYTSEDHDSGTLFYNAVVDPGFRNMFLQIRPDNWSWGWMNDQMWRIGAPNGDEAVNQIPVRGHADTALENQMVATKVLTPQQVLRVRALDWQNPVFSEFRCNLWKNAYDKFLASPPDFGTASRNLDVMPALFEEMLNIDGVPLNAGDQQTIIAMPIADASNVAALKIALESGSVGSGTCQARTGFCAVTADELGGLIHEFILEVAATGPRDFLREQRRQRICHLTTSVEPHDDDDRFEGNAQRIPAQPSLPEVSCP